MRFIASFFFIVVIAAGPPVAAQEYQLVEPSGVITADVYFSSGQMTINDANGRQYLLNRDRSLDSYNGQYSGYLLPPVNRVVRFPRSGTGLMQIADLDDAFPRSME